MRDPAADAATTGKPEPDLPIAKNPGRAGGPQPGKSQAGKESCTGPDDLSNDQKNLKISFEDLQFSPVSSPGKGGILLHRVGGVC